MHAILRSNSLRLLVLLWFSGWLLLVMPGHKRGIVTLPGAEIEQAQAQSEGQSCCKPKPSCCDIAADDCETPKPIDPAKHCAICFLKSHLTDPPATVLYTPYLGELDELAYLLKDTIAYGIDVPKRTRGRAPPA